MNESEKSARSAKPNNSMRGINEDLDIYIEVKGRWRDDAEAKFQAFKQQYPEIIIQVLDKNKLTNLGLNL